MYVKVILKQWPREAPLSSLYLVAFSICFITFQSKLEWAINMDVEISDDALWLEIQKYRESKFLRVWSFCQRSIFSWTVSLGFHMNTLNMIRQSPKKQIDLSNQFSQMEHSSLIITWMYSSTAFFDRGVSRYFDLHIYIAYHDHSSSASELLQRTITLNNTKSRYDVF